MKPFRSLHFRRIAPFAAALPLAARAASPLLLPGGTTMLSSGSAEETRKSLVAVGKSLAEDTSTEVWIVQYDPEKTLASAIRNLVSGAGARILSPVSGGAYLVRATRAQQLAILESGQIEATRQYDPSHKCAPINDSGPAKGFALGGESSGDAIFVVSAFGDTEENVLRAKIAALGGCEVLDGIGDHLRVRMTAAGRTAAATLPEVASIGEWIEPRLINDVAVRAMRVDSIWPSHQAPAEQSAVQSQASALSPRRVAATDLFSKGLLTVDGFDAAGPAVARDASRQSEVAVAVAAAGSATSSATDAPTFGLTGKGQIVAVCDSGLDTGNLSTLHPDVRGRIVAHFGYGRPVGAGANRFRDGKWSDGDLENGHGTHVIGSVLGNGASSGGNIRGAAYEASLVVQSHTDSNGSLGSISSVGFLKMLEDAHGVVDGKGNAPHIHSNSWGPSPGLGRGQYNENSEDADRFSFANPDFLVVAAAGNDGIDEEKPLGVVDCGHMGAPASAKNSLAVGNCENSRVDGPAGRNRWTYGNWGSVWFIPDGTYRKRKIPDKFPNEPIYSDYQCGPPKDSSGHRGMAAGSSRGPCVDGRVKPDVVAPGQEILSLHSSLVKPDIWTYKTNPRYRFMSGTSMATPLVAGTAALVRQWCAERCGIANPDAATVKAVLCAGAKSLYPGQYGEGQFLEIPKEYPNNVEGWGMVDLENSVANPDGVAVKDGAIIAEGESATFRFRAPGGKPLCILMAYSDAPATAFSGGLVNDLDLTVTDPAGKRWYPNSKNGPDAVNNVEGVRWTAAPAGEYVATVRARSIQAPMDAGWTQNRENAVRFSLVANGALQAE